MTASEAIEGTESRGLPDAATARANALTALRDTLAAAADHARSEALGDLGLCLSTAVTQAKAIQAFDLALIHTLPMSERDEAMRFVRQRDAASLWSPTPDDIPF